LNQVFVPQTIAAGAYSSFITSTTGKVVAFGLNGFGQLGLPIELEVSFIVTKAVLRLCALLAPECSDIRASTVKTILRTEENGPHLPTSSIIKHPSTQEAEIILAWCRMTRIPVVAL